MIVTDPTADTLTEKATALRSDTAPAPVAATILPTDRLMVTAEDDVARTMQERISGVSTVAALDPVADIVLDADFRTVTAPLAP